MSKPWWEDFFDADYLRLWKGMVTEERTREEVEGLWQLLDLQEGSRILDAPCGYGRLSRPLAVRGAQVLGVEQSQVLIAQAERDRKSIEPVFYEVILIVDCLLRVNGPSADGVAFEKAAADFRRWLWADGVSRRSTHQEDRADSKHLHHLTSCGLRMVVIFTSG